jgi:hypothetical protein
MVEGGIVALVPVPPLSFEALIFQLLISMYEAVGLYSSMNSSLAPRGPLVRNSLITTLVDIPEDVLVAVAVFVAVPVAVAVLVAVPVFVGVPVSVGVPVLVAVLVGVEVGRMTPHKLNGDAKFCGRLGVIS